MASEFTSEDSRWEITMTVRPLAIRRMFSLTMASLSGSRALVASSRINIFGSRISARAIASLWRCPPDRFGEPS